MFSPKCSCSKAKTLHLEPLERRLLLSLPSVSAVNVAGSDWSTGFINHLESSGLGTDGYAIPSGSDQLKTLPWINIDQIRITFSENVNVQESDLSLSGVNTTADAFSDFSYDSNSCTAVWTLANPLGADKVRIDLNGAGLGPVTDVDEGNILDGEWTDGTSSFPSGNSSAGGDFEFRFNVLPADADGSSYVNSIDVAQIGSKKGTVAGDAGYNVRHDLDGDGDIDQSDYTAAQARVATGLPAGNPAGASNDAPSTCGLTDVSIDEDAADYLVRLCDAFDDEEDLDEDLLFQVVGNTNSSLFDSLNIDSYGGLWLDLAQDAYGSAELTILVTDTGGLFTETTLFVTVDPVNDAPVISNFAGVHVSGYYWMFSGYVTDVDDSVEGLIVALGGILDGYNVTATVQADGTFSVTAEFAGLQSGNATAQTQDSHYAWSNLATYWISC